VARKRRLRRKELKQPDEFLTLTAQALIWGRAHPQFVIWGGLGLLVASIVVFVIVSFQSARSHDSNTDLGHAMLAAAGGQPSNAATAYDEIARRWPSAAAGKVATILGANAELRQGNDAKASELLQRALDSSDGLPQYLRQELLFASGYALERRESWNEAAEKYAAAAALPGPFAAPAVLGEARVRERAGDKDRAQQLYTAFVEKFPDFPDHALVSAKIGHLPENPKPAAPIEGVKP
jgi:tetratricopeptide (TPR) repeat protein